MNDKKEIGYENRDDITIEVAELFVKRMKEFGIDLEDKPEEEKLGFIRQIY